MDKDPQERKTTSPDQRPPSDSSVSAGSIAPETPSPDAAAAPETPAATQTTNSAPAPKANGEAKKDGYWASFKRKAKTSWTFAKEAWDEHDLWIEALAVKGGASAIIIAGVVGLSSVVALPFFAAALVIAGCGALIGVGIYGCAAGGAKAWESIKNVYNRVMGREPIVKPKKERKDIVARLAETKWVKKAVENPWAQKIFNSRAWKQTQKFTKRREDSILQGMAVGGALVTLALGATVLATQVLVLPVVAVGGLLTWAVAEVAVCFASGIYGLYLSGESIMKKRREKKQAASDALEKPLQLDAPPPVAPVAGKTPETPALAETFTEQARANDNIPAPANDAAKPPEKVAVPAAQKPKTPGQP
jgi:hypothetical protein